MRSDFSAIHGLREPMEELDSADYWEKAERLAAYPGMMRFHAEERARKEQEQGAPAAPRQPPRGRSFARPSMPTAGKVGSATSTGPVTAGQLALAPETRGAFDFE